MVDWDPFCDPAGETQEEDAVAKPAPAVAAEEPAPRPAADAGLPDLDLLQPWELDQLDQETLERAEEERAKANSKRTLRAFKLALPSVSELEQELAVLAKTAPIPATLGCAKPVPKLTKAQALALEEALIAAYRTDDFQRQLHGVWAAAEGDPARQELACQELCLSAQVPVITQFGFEASRRGAAQSLSALQPLATDPDVAERGRARAWLASPGVQLGLAGEQPGRRLKPCSDLVDKAIAGDLAGVRKLLDEGADPNTIVLKEERLKGSDGCCQCTITSEEYTPLIAACMHKHTELVALLLGHAATDVNVVCVGVNQEFGPYKHFTALDLAKIVQCAPALEQLRALGAKFGRELPEPSWPRPTPEGTLEPPRKPEPPELPPLDERKYVAPVPAAEVGCGAAVEEVTSDLVAAMREHCSDTPEERLRFFRQLMLEWHPDKRPEGDSELATAVCQWLNGPAKCFVGHG